ncbi:MAG: hypothetical protein DMG40_15205 [Acidobacteria bacterium]|nr:MAG: hypothetical protein DMG40_15205 [Acidobacteriota bacterium]
MLIVLNFAVLAITTMLAAAAAAALSWMSLRMAFVLMRPATAGNLSPRTDLARGRSATGARLLYESLRRAGSAGTD